MSAPLSWQLRDRLLTPGSPPLVMGIVNVTPDSFSDGGRFLAVDAAVNQARRVIDQGADLLDLGGESSRPGAQPVPLEEELARVLPVVRRLVGQISVPLSIDTSKAEVARQALEEGAHIINDITALESDPAMLDVVKQFQAGVILMHMRGTPATMQKHPHYDDVVREVADYLETRLKACVERGIAAERIVLDPGIGFGKTSAHNLRLLAHLEELRHLDRPVCLGVSRKGFFGQVTSRPVEQRLAASLAAACYGLVRQTVQIVRVHDVGETRDVVALLQALRDAY